MVRRTSPFESIVFMDSVGGNPITFPYTFTSNGVDFYMYAQWLRQVTVTTVFGNGEANGVVEYLENDVIEEPVEPVISETVEVTKGKKKPKKALGELFLKKDKMKDEGAAQA